MVVEIVFVNGFAVDGKELPIIFLTVRSDSHDIVSGFQNGADDYVVKPLN